MSACILKLLAAACMLIDHAGMLLFPDKMWMRAVGRLAFPIFAYMIAEGCTYTRSRGKYFAQMAGLALVCQLVYFFEHACAISGAILGVNPFNQPGVELYKRNMFQLLGKPGYEV
mgnify:CR=1 FL=1